jgi:uncharacterized protein
MSFLDLAELKSSRRAGRLVRVPPEMDVPVTPRVLRLIDTPAFQRLGEIAQLGLVARVYPGARHTRFEHSLGVYRLALVALEQLAGDAQFMETVSQQDAAMFVLAALLHDIGHWPYCHPIEDMRLEHVRRHEAHARDLIVHGEIGRLIERDWRVDPAQVAALIEPASATRDGIASDAQCTSQGLALVRGLLSGPIDIDKLDYLQRDSMHAGVPYGRNFDQRRLLSSLCVGPSGQDIGITIKGKTAAEMMVFSRYVMFSEVYWHHAVRSATAMLQRLIYACGGRAQPADWVAWGDPQMHEQLLRVCAGDADTEPLAQALFGRRRQLYKRLLEFNYAENPEAHRALARRSYAELVDCASRMAERLSRSLARPLKATDILIDAPPVKLEVQFNLSVRTPEGQYQSLASLSPVVRSLATDQFDNYVKRVHVFIAPDRRGDLVAKPELLVEHLLAAAH